MVEYNRDRIDRQNQSSFIQQIFIEYLKHASANLGLQIVLDTAFKNLCPMGLPWGRTGSI